MRTFWGAATEISDLGVVAEHCPHCQCLMSCLLRSVCRGDYVCFVKTAGWSWETSYLCTGCHKTFPGEPYWHYAAVVPIREAQTMELDCLLAKTNPVLADRIHFKQQLSELGGDDRFAAAFEHLERMRPGALRADLLRELLDWQRLEEEQRAELGEHISALTRAWRFTRQMAIGFPVSAGCLTYVVAALVVGLVLLCLPAARGWLGGTIVAVSGLIAAAVVHHMLLMQSVRRWTRNVLIPKAQDADVSLDYVISIVDDVPGSKVGLADDLWPMKEQLQTICATLIAEGKLQPVPS